METAVDVYGQVISIGDTVVYLNGGIAKGVVEHIRATKNRLIKELTIWRILSDKLVERYKKENWKQQMIGEGPMSAYTSKQKDARATLKI